MAAKYEYKFVRIGEGWLAAHKSARTDYHAAIESHAADGWRLVQVFAPSFGAYGASKYVELILERELGA